MRSPSRSPSGHSSSARRAGAGLVAIGVHARELVERAQQRLERPRALVRGEPVRGDLDSGAAAGLEGLGQAPVEGPAPRPGHVLVDGVAGQRMAEGARAGLGLGHAARWSSSSASPASPPSAATSSRSKRGPATDAASAAARAASDSPAARRSTASRMVSGTGISPFPASSSPAPRGQPPAGLQRRGQLLDEERHALGSVVDRLASAGGQRRAEDLLGQRCGALGVERLERELAQRAVRRSSLRRPRSGCARGTSSER